MRDPSKATTPWDEILDEPLEPRIERCKADIANFKLGWRFSRQPADGLHFSSMGFGRTDTSWIGSVSIYPWIDGGKDLQSATFREALARNVFYNLLPSKPPKHPLRSHDDQNKLETAICEACLPELLGVVDKIIERLKVALEKEEIQENNRRLRLEALVQPLYDALRDGVSVEAIRDLVAMIEKEPKKPHLNLKETLEKIGANLAQRQKTA